MRIPCTIMRGGTSKGVILRDENLPRDPARRDRVILRIFGSPDRRQIDGLGGADPLTSKAAIIAKPTRADADLDYTFTQVGITEGRVDYGGNCGNISAAVAMYGVDEGYVPATAPMTVVRIHNTNTGKLILAEVPTADSRAIEEGEFEIAGVPGSGACIRLDFADTVGSATGRLLPTGAVADRVAVAGLGEVQVSVVDVANPMVFLPAAILGVAASDGPDELDTRKEFIDAMEALRIEVASVIGLVKEDGTVSDNIPLVAVVAPPSNYHSFTTGRPVAAEAMDLWSRELFLRAIHKAYGVAETICTAVAALIPGTVVNAVACASAARLGRVRIGHPSGVIETEVALKFSDQEPVVQRAVVGRTARRILDGVVRIPDNV